MHILSYFESNAIKKLWKFIIPFTLVAVLFLYGCSNRSNNLKEKDSKGTLIVGNGTEPQDLDPHIVTGVPEQRILSALMEGLVVENPKTLAPEPGVAESWAVSDNGLVYTFNLRKTAKWSNGAALTAGDFVYAYHRILSPKLGSQNAYLLYCIKNAKEFNEGKIKNFDDVGVKALNEFTLQISLNSPTPYFLSLITHMAWFPIYKPAIEKFGKMEQRGTKWTLPGNFISDGAFELKDWKLNEGITVVKNPYYWDKDNVKLNKIVFKPINDAQTEESAFRGGQLDVTYTVPSDKVEKYLESNPELIRVSPYLGTFYLVFNVQKKPFDNLKLREALALAIDKTALAKNVVKGGKLPAWSFTPPNTAGYTCDTVQKENLQEAKKLLAEAGYPNGSGLEPIEISYNSSERNRRIAEAIQSMWKKNLNVDSLLINKEWKVYLDAFRTKDFSVAAASWIGDYNDPSTFLDLWTNTSSNNRAGWKNSKYSELIQKASITVNKKERNLLFNDAESILLKDAPIVPLYYYTSLALIRVEVKGYYPNILDHHPYKNVYFDTAVSK